MDLRLPRRRSPFKTAAGIAAYADALGQEGPIGRIFQRDDLRIASAKGGSRFPQYRDQTLFAHALNVSTVGGIFYEEALTRGGAEVTEAEMRIVIAAGALHDFNKHFPNVSLRLAELLVKERGELEALLAGYVPGEHVDEVCHVLLHAEETDRKHAHAYGRNVLTGRRAAVAAQALNLADALTGHTVDPNDPASYLKVLRHVQERTPDLGEVRVQALTRVPQAALATRARRILLRWICGHGYLIHETDTFVSWLGPAVGAEQAKPLDAELWSALAPDLHAAFSNSAPTHNALRAEGWTAYHEPTPERVDAWIEHYGGRLVLWQGDWGVRHFHRLQEDFGCLIYEAARKRVRVVLSEPDESAGEESARARLRAKQLIAHTIEKTLLKEKSLPEQPPDGYDFEGLAGVMPSTVSGIFTARLEPATPDNYQATLQRISKILGASRTEFENPVEGFLEELLGFAAPVASAGDTGSGCTFCGRTATTGVSDNLVFGIKPTTWAPRKRGILSENHTGVICDRCILENSVRAREADEQKALSEKEFVSVHLHAADLVCDANWNALADKLGQDVEVQGEEATLVLLPKGGKKAATKLEGQRVPLRGHVSIRIPRVKATKATSETAQYLYRLRDLLEFCIRTGFKLHVSALYLAPRHQVEHFVWENPPAWMASLTDVDLLHGGNLARVRTTELTRRLQQVQALLQLGRDAGGSQGHRTVASQALTRPLSIYNHHERRNANVDILGEMLVTKENHNQLELIARPYTEFNERIQTWSKNHWTWATRTALEELENAPKELTSSERRDFIIAAVWAEAERANAGAKGKEAAAALKQNVADFVDALLEFLRANYDGKPPFGGERRALINAIRYKCTVVYRPREKKPAAEIGQVIQ